LITLDVLPGLTSTAAWGINNAGQIVGYYAALGGGFYAHGFLATPK